MADVKKPTKKVVIKAQRKAKGGQGKQRGGKTGKIGYFYRLFDSGEEELVTKVYGPTFRKVQSLLRKGNQIPTNVVLKHHGTTTF